MKEDRKNQAERLFQKYKEGKTTAREEELLRNWFASFEGEESNSNFTKTRSENLLSRIHQDIAQHRKKSKLFQLYKYGIAASFVAISIATAAFFYSQSDLGKPDAEVVVLNKENNHNKAILELADGRKVSVEDLDHLDVNIPGVHVDNENGIITFVPSENLQSSIAYHTIQTPVGGEYTIVLSDGSQVKLNANSSIKFPNKFENIREVYVNGEVFFQVKRDSEKKFIVHTNHQLLEVIGTSFNVKSYVEDKVTTTTLESGSLKVSDNATDKTILLSPGQSAISGDRIALQIKNVQVHKESAWRSGEFHFDGENLEEVLNTIARWYDVKIVYEYIPSKTASYGGIISRDKDLSSVLSLLADKEDLVFEVVGKEVIVKKAN